MAKLRKLTTIIGSVGNSAYNKVAGPWKKHTGKKRRRHATKKRR
jgi:hypothetical protein